MSSTQTQPSVNNICQTCEQTYYIRIIDNKFKYYCRKCGKDADGGAELEKMEAFYFKPETRVIMRNLCPSKYCNNVNCGVMHNDERNHEVRMIASRKGWYCWCCWKCYKQSNTVRDCGDKKNATDYKITNPFRYN